MYIRNVARLVFIATVLGLLSGFNVTACAAERDDALSGQRQTLRYDGIERSYVYVSRVNFRKARTGAAGAPRRR